MYLNTASKLKVWWSSSRTNYIATFIWLMIDQIQTHRQQISSYSHTCRGPLKIVQNLINFISFLITCIMSHYSSWWKVLSSSIINISLFESIAFISSFGSYTRLNIFWVITYFYITSLYWSFLVLCDVLLHAWSSPIGGQKGGVGDRQRQHLSSWSMFRESRAHTQMPLSKEKEIVVSRTNS
jgi:hypothetical protein